MDICTYTDMYGSTELQNKSCKNAARKKPNKLYCKLSILKSSHVNSFLVNIYL